MPRAVTAAALLIFSSALAAQQPPPPAAARPAAASSPAIRHVIVVSVDGLVPETYTRADERGLKIPTLRKMMAEGAWSGGARGVFPTVTYPSHTTIATGTNPGTHGILTNQAWDPMQDNAEGWRWYSEDIRVPALWDAAREKGLRTALLFWPVTAGARAGALIPEIWRASNQEDTKLTRALSTPGLTREIVRKFPRFWEGFDSPLVKDSSGTDAAVHVIESRRPHLLLLHIFEVDHEQHEEGMWSEKARAAIENADAQIARIIAAARKAGIWNNTALVVVSDHGFRPISRRVRPGVLLARNGLVQLNDRREIVEWKAVVQAGAGHAYIYVKDFSDSATRQKLEEILRPLAGSAGSGIGRVYSREEIRELGGDPEAFLALEGAEGFGITDGYWGDLISPATSVATHGFDPRAADMQTSLLIYGPAIPPGKIPDARLLDVAPTIARWLGLRLERAEGNPLQLPGRQIRSGGTRLRVPPQVR